MRGRPQLTMRKNEHPSGREKRDILFLCQFFYPEYNSSATLPFDMARYLASHGFTVDALAGYPREYSPEKHPPLRETAEGVGITRVRYLQLNRAGAVGRLINYFSLTFRAWVRMSRFRDYRAVIVTSNPPVLPIVAVRAKRKYGIRLVFVAYDVYPEVAYASGALTPGCLISRVMKRLNRRVYASADCVVAITDEMREFLLERRPELTPDRVITIANWAHEKEGRADSAAYRRFGYPEGQFIVSYFGNVGTCQDVETMLQAAELLKDDGRIRFLIAGHGNKKAAVEARIREKELKNVQLKDFLTGKDFEQAVAVSSCCIVSLERGLKGTCAPSKYLSYLQGGKPVLAVVEEDSYLAAEIEREQIGCRISIGDGMGLRDAILALAEHPEECREQGTRAKALYRSRYTKEAAMEKYRAVFTEKCGIRKE